MGNTAGATDEQPERTVFLDGFSITTFEITEQEYGVCVAAGKCTPAHYDDGVCRAWNGRKFVSVRVPAQFRHPGYPVVCITWHQALQYCRVQGMSLPTEAQWEYAARAGTKTEYPWGNKQSGTSCVIGQKNCPRTIGSSPANSWGMHDMIGNVWEWVSDRYDSEEYRYGSRKNPEGPLVGLYRVVRGGGWYSKPENATVSNRQWFSPDYGEVSIGFRCVKNNHPDFRNCK